MTSHSKAYEEAGVSIDAGYSLVSRIKKHAASTHIQGVLSDLGGFGGLFKPDLGGMEAPVLVASTDGVGTKVKLASEFNKHEGIGQDLVAMCVNDIVVQGARPLFFLDYFACGKLDVDKAEAVIASVAKGCKLAGCALLGGETAEMPDMYAEGEYDLAGFCVGIVDNAKVIDGSQVRAGDAVIGINSTGVHANGYSLVRKLLAQSGLGPDDLFPGTEQSVSDVLMTPTAIYVEAVRHLMRDLPLKGMAHITGGGFYENIPRALPDQLAVKLNFSAWTVSPVFHWLREQAGISWMEMLHIFNCGIGYVVIVAPEYAEEVISRLNAMNATAQLIGNVNKRSPKQAEQVVVRF